MRYQIEKTAIGMGSIKSEEEKSQTSLVHDLHKKGKDTNRVKITLQPTCNHKPSNGV